MPDIRYVSLSDMHLGAENSLLTDLKNNSVETDTMMASPVMIQLAACLRDVISKNKGAQKPTLILNGDLMELALTSTNFAAMDFQRFIELVMPANEERLFDNEIIFLPGNHDHNLWETGRNMYYVSLLKDIKPGAFVPKEIHSTQMFTPEYINSFFLTGLIHCYPHLQDVTVKTCYPSFAEQHPVDDKCIIFSHGHYIESMYSLMTSFTESIFPDQQKPQTLENLEIENYAWVDFFWSTLGRSGLVGKDIDLIYDKLQDAGAVDQMLENIAGSHVQQHKSFIRRWFEKKALMVILKMTLGRMAAGERNEPDVILTDDAMAGLKKFLEIQTYNQLKQELNGKIPADISFIFGHTHKPFLKSMQFDQFANPIKLYNSGGWVIDTLNVQPLHGGAVILADENFDVVALQMFKEDNYTISLEEIKKDGETNSTFFDQLQQTINFSAEPWTNFADVTKQSVNIRYADLAKIVKEN